MSVPHSFGARYFRAPVGGPRCHAIRLPLALLQSSTPRQDLSFLIASRRGLGPRRSDRMTLEVVIAGLDIHNGVDGPLDLQVIRVGGRWERHLRFGRTTVIS